MLIREGGEEWGAGGGVCGGVWPDSERDLELGSRQGELEEQRVGGGLGANGERISPCPLNEAC